MRLVLITLRLQTIYYMVTAVWPLVHIDSFIAVTGPKTDIWLVKTVAVLLMAISGCFIAQLVTKINPWPTAVLAIGCCMGLIFIDCYYALHGTISKIYLLDAVLEFLLLIMWVIALLRLR